MSHSQIALLCSQLRLHDRRLFANNSAINTKYDQARQQVYSRSKYRPIRPGTSAASYLLTDKDAPGGTICCIVHKAGSADLYVVGTNLTFAPAKSRRGDDILQPSPSDGGKTNRDDIASLTDIIDPYIIKPPIGIYGVLAKLKPGIGASQVVPLAGIGRIVGLATSVKSGEKVYILGRTSGLVGALIKETGITETIDIDEQQSLTFRGIIRIECDKSVIQAGDNGSPVLTDQGQLVGMIIAWNGHFAAVLPMDETFQRFGVQLLTK